MKFEDLEATWSLQQPAAPAPAALDALKQSLKSQLGRRKRMLILAGAGALFGLVAMQLIFLVGLRAPQPASPWVSLGRLLLHQGISLVIVIEIARVYLRHRRLAQGRADSMRDVVVLSVASVEGEMNDYRLGGWMLVVLSVHSLFSTYLNMRELGFGWDGFTLRAGMIFAVYGLIGLLSWRHYRRVLQPRQAELQARLKEMEAAG